MDLAAFTTQGFLTYVLILFRVGAIMVFAPFFGSAFMPEQVKVVLSMVIALVLLPVVPALLPHELTIGYLLKAAATESLVGLVIGYAASLIFVGVELAGMQVGQQMGTEIGAIFNPFLESQSSLVGQFYFLFATFIFLGIGGHHVLLSALVASFNSVPMGSALPTERSLGMLITLFGHVFTVAFAVSAPVVLALFLTTVAMGFVARTVPQMNILIIGFPVRIVVGLSVMAITLPAIGYYLAKTIGVVMRGMPGLVLSLR